MSAAPTVSVSILAFQDRETIGPCLESVLNLDHPGDLEIRIREQGSDDEQARLIANIAEANRSSGRSITLDRGPNLGFAPGHNANIRESGGEFQLLVNSDAKLEPSFLTEALSFFEDPAVGSVQGKLLNPEVDLGGQPVIDTIGFVARRNRVFGSRGQGEPDRGQFDDPGEIFGADGAVPIYRRAALEDVAVPRQLNPPHFDRTGSEWLDETFFAYKCDLDLAWRLRLRGWKSILAPKAISDHSRTLAIGSARTIRQRLTDRRASPKWRRSLSFCNQRLMLIKNEDLGRLMKDSLSFVPAEAAAWGLVALEGLWGALPRLAKLAPSAYRKRRFIRERRKVDVDPYEWFE
jgi:GT2 family glycosyltransferase